MVSIIATVGQRRRDPRHERSRIRRASPAAQPGFDELHIKSPHVVIFLDKLLRVVRGKLLIVWDGLAMHRGRLVKDFIASQQGRIAIERLPAYAPELNPVEYIWAHLKRHELPMSAPRICGVWATSHVRSSNECAAASPCFSPAGSNLLYPFKTRYIMRFSISTSLPISPADLTVLLSATLSTLFAHSRLGTATTCR